MERTDLEAVKALLTLGEKATEGEWFVFDGGRAECKQFIAYEDPKRPAVGTPLTLGAVWSGGAEEINPDAAFIAASKNALPAIRSLMEVAEAARGLLNNFDELDRMTNVEEIERLESALSRLGGK